ncbi:hypothetical protein SH1V18_13390 [Vallitalea longa]|uniref:Lipoprotein n=1 Tax=Vallitalea longa TaxID=2936439 RepID=A0A9W5Y967_9FIRM|nr:hypothetical protein [Vallitalea longa]GKX28859.1 hypothetical protein SH1V18_13390 [Vallitalea longa]
MKKKLILLSIIIIMVLCLMTGCMPGDPKYTVTKPAGFFWGIWHGWIAPISLIVGLFKENVRVYELVNTGWWYDFGFYIAIISGFGGLSLFRKKKSNDKHH